MKKIILIIFLSFCFIYKVNASDTFYLGDHVPNIYIYMDRINKKVYRQFRMIYKTGSNELVYCIEPGETLSNGEYESYIDYQNKFNLSLEKWDKIKLIAYYGYNYINHTDIKWYAITQYIIWKEVMPSSWDMYFVDENHNRLDNLFENEINEIYDLVNNHTDYLGLGRTYLLNYSNEITIFAKDNIKNYEPSSGVIEKNKLTISNLNVGMNNFRLTHKNYTAPMFYFNDNGQNIFKRGDVLNEVVNFSVYVHAGKVRVNECNEENFNYDFVGGTYEVLNQDDEVIDTFTCENSECISNYLPIGYHKIRVKSLSNYYEVNEHIYDIEVKDREIAEVDICSLPRKKEKPRKIEVPEEPTEPEEPDIPEETPDDIPEEDVIESQDIIAVLDENNEEVIDIPYTSKNTYFKYIFLFPLLFCFIKLRKLNENNN